MDDIRETKSDVRKEISKRLGALSKEQLLAITDGVTKQLFEFANFIEANIALLYIHKENEVSTEAIIRRSYDYHKVVVLPAFNIEKHSMKLMKVEKPDTDLVKGPRGIWEPNPGRCKSVPIEVIDIAIIPGIAFDEKGGRIGSGEGYYDRLMPKLPATTRKVGLAYELQIFPQVPMTSHDRYVDIIITEERIIYKI
jgi:5-formyltetrahydrofolate cyclo-ligase